VQVEVEAESRRQRALLERVLASRHFREVGPVYRRFFATSANALLQDRKRLTEQSYRGPRLRQTRVYDCSADNSFRNYARHLRNRLEDYYRWEGQSELPGLEVRAWDTSQSFSALTRIPSGDAISASAEDHAAMFTRQHRDHTRIRSQHAVFVALFGHHRSAWCVLGSFGRASGRLCCVVALRRVSGQACSPPEPGHHHRAAYKGFGTLQDY